MPRVGGRPAEVPPSRLLAAPAWITMGTIHGHAMGIGLRQWRIAMAPVVTTKDEAVVAPGTDAPARTLEPPRQPTAEEVALRVREDALQAPERYLRETTVPLGGE